MERMSYISMANKIKELIGFFLLIDRNTAVHFHSCEFEQIPDDVLNKIKDKSIIHNIIRIQDDDSIMCGFYFIILIECMIAEKTLLDYTNSFSPNDYQMNDNVHDNKDNI